MLIVKSDGKMNFFIIKKTRWKNVEEENQNSTTEY